MANKQQSKPQAAKPKKAAPKKSFSSSNSKEVYLYPSYFGSHASMIDEAVTATLTTPNAVACRDEFGLYVTERSRLDNGLADPYRYKGGRMFETIVKKVE